MSLVQSAYRGEISRKGWTTEADLLGGQRTDADEIASVLRDPAAQMVLAYNDSQILGCVLLRDEKGTAYIGMLAIRPEQQAQGLGRQLLQQAEQIAAGEFKAQRARMTVIIQRENLISWYVRRGYRITNQREPFPYGNPRFGLPKRPDLQFVVLEKDLRVR